MNAGKTIPGAAMLLAALSLAVPSVVPAATMPPASSALRSLLREMERVYLIPQSVTLEETLNQGADMTAALLGLTMHRQMVLLEENPGNIDRFEALKDEAIAFILALGRENDFTDPATGEPLPPDMLEIVFMRAMSGGMDQWYRNGLGIDPATVDMSFVVPKVTLPGSRDGSDNGTGDTKDGSDKGDGNKIIIFGQEAPPVVSHSEPFRGFEPEPEIVREPIRKNDILGRWASTGPDCWTDTIQKNPSYITFTRGSGGALYVGRDSGTVYTIHTEEQTDPYTISYTGSMKTSNGGSIGYGCWDDTEVSFSITRNEENTLVLCIGECGSLVPVGYVRP